MTDEIHGLLSTIAVKIPRDDSESVDRTDFWSDTRRAFCRAVDWGLQTNDRRKPAHLRAGQMAKVFRTITDGPVAWQGIVRHRGRDGALDLGISDDKRSQLFGRHMPARLERDGKAIFGHLQFEAEMEGPRWLVREYGKDPGPTGYGGHHLLTDGDRLTVYRTVRDGDIEWEGALDFAQRQTAKIGNDIVLRQTTHMDTKKWLEFSNQHRPVIIS